MFEIVRYSSIAEKEWNDFVASSKNGTFLFDRQYMDYHQDRFQDFSLMFYRNNKLFALLPANVKGDTLQSHGGLTYGGLIMNSNVTTSATMELFSELNIYLKTNGIRHVLYKRIPWIYDVLPSDEDLYAIFRTCNARLAARDIGTVITQEQKLKWRNTRTCGMKKAKGHGVIIDEKTDFPAFWQILDDNLMGKYNVHPVHSLKEIELLKSRFPEKIKLHTASMNGTMVAGVVVYITPQVAHTQYISANVEGKKYGALDLLIHHVIEEYSDYRYFDFGRSTENRGQYLNESLIFQKEGFGGRGLCWDWYEWDVE